jgi:hypothetical protein
MVNSGVESTDSSRGFQPSHLFRVGLLPDEAGGSPLLNATEGGKSPTKVGTLYAAAERLAYD